MSGQEIILNLWYVIDDEGLIYSLRARCYVHSGTDEEKLAFLRSQPKGRALFVPWFVNVDSHVSQEQCHHFLAVVFTSKAKRS